MKRGLITYTTPARGRAAKLHAARHVGILAILSAHGQGITVGCAAITAKVWTIATNAFWSAATVINTWSIFAGERSITPFGKRPQAPGGRIERDRVVSGWGVRNRHRRGLGGILMRGRELDGISPREIC
jgi:hypothetical protein